MTAVVIPLPNIWGASPEDWNHFDVMLGLGEDLLPVVSNPHVTIAESSKLKSLGKVPSVYTRDRKVVGIPKWTVHCSTQAEIDGWMTERDYGICVQTRRCRGIDIDVEDPVKASRLVAWFEKSIGQGVSKRVREGTGKCLIPVMVDGELAKTVIRVDGGTVEILGNGQQFIAVGTHPKGSRYQWEGGPFNKWPVMELSVFREMLAEFAAAYAVEPVLEGKLPSEAAPDLKGVDDPVADWLGAQGLVLREEPRGLIVECPWHDEHSTGGEEAIWMPAGGRGKPEGHFRCLHAHCEGRTRREYLEAVGYVEDVASQFEDLGAEEPDVPLAEMVEQHKAGRFPILPIGDFIKRPHPGWLIKGLIPRADLVVVYGESGSGKSFIVTDMALALARGVSWRACRTRACRVLYIVAEGGGGYVSRLQAYAAHHAVDISALPFGIIHAAPNFTKPEDVAAVVASVRAWGGADVVIVDTFAQVTAGANENAGEDMGSALANARLIGRAAGGTVILVHHSGKDAARGARGWSGIKAAADAELEVLKGEDGKRVLRTTKQKDGRDDGSWGFSLQPVWLGEDEDGDPVESCVVVEEDAPVAVAPRDGKRQKRLGGREAAVMEAFAEMSLGTAQVSMADLAAAAAERHGGSVPGNVARSNMVTTIKGLVEKRYLGAIGSLIHAGVREA